jgi:phage terminase large subunit
LSKKIKIEYVKNLYPIFTKPKRIKIIVGGRGSTKSTGVADYVACKMATGELWCCARENQNSIEESVHRTILDEIGRLGIDGFEETKTSITHLPTGGRAFYRGLARNITSLKSTLSGIDGLWIEEGEDISANTLRVLTASVRLNAEDTEKLLDGNKLESIDQLDKLLADSNIKMPEIIITMNRGARTGAVAQKWLARAERDLQRCGYYEDDLIMVVEMNYTDMPQSWFIASGLEQERIDDEKKLSKAAYDHKWHGKYLDEVENSIIKPEWFDAAIDAHKLPHLAKAFEPKGAKFASHDPSDGGNDPKGYALRHGSIFLKILEKTDGEIDEGCDWATDQAIKDGADWFIWDGDGMGAGLKRQVSTAFQGKNIRTHMFRGSLSGIGQDNAEEVYLPTDSDENMVDKPKTYAETFLNNRSQYCIRMADLYYNTYRCVVRGEYVDPADMISIDSKGVESMDRLRSEVCRVPRKRNNTGLIQIMTKKEMKSLGIDSPNMFDSKFMNLFEPPIEETWQPINYQAAGIV